MARTLPWVDRFGRVQERREVLTVGLFAPKAAVVVEFDERKLRGARWRAFASQKVLAAFTDMLPHFGVSQFQVVLQLVSIHEANNRHAVLLPLAGTSMGIKEVVSAPRSPWQRAYVERVIGTIRRECLDPVIVFNETSLYRHVESFTASYHESRTHLSLAKDTPEPRPVHPPELGPVVAIPQVGGLHHRYRLKKVA